MSAPPQSDPDQRRTTVRVIKRRVCGNEIGSPEDDDLAIEDPLEIVLTSGGTQRVLSVTMRTPGHDEDLLTGFLFAEGIVSNASQIEEFVFERRSPDTAPIRATVRLTDRAQPKFAHSRAQTTLNSACGICGTGALADLRIPADLQLTDETRVSAGWIHGLPDRMRASQPTFAKTGGLHAAAVFHQNGHLITAREDIGRHNALDKAIGAGLRSNHLPVPGRVLCVSGRMSYEILQKALVARIPIIAGVGAPSSLAVTLATDFGATLLGFVRGGSFNIYSGAHRIT